MWNPKIQTCVKSGGPEAGLVYYYRGSLQIQTCAGPTSLASVTWSPVLMWTEEVRQDHSGCKDSREEVNLGPDRLTQTIRLTKKEHLKVLLKSESLSTSGTRTGRCFHRKGDVMVLSEVPDHLECLQGLKDNLKELR